MEQELGRPVTFVPHLVRLDRGILETIYAKCPPGQPPNRSATRSTGLRQEPFVRLTGEALPEIKHVAWTNFCDIGWRLDSGSRRLVIVACLDNLVKGAAGQALQNFNVACRFENERGCCDRPSGAEARGRAAGITADRQRIAALPAAKWRPPGRSSSCTAAGAPSTPSSPSAGSRQKGGWSARTMPPRSTLWCRCWPVRRTPSWWPRSSARACRPSA